MHTAIATPQRHVYFQETNLIKSFLGKVINFGNIFIAEALLVFVLF